MDLVELAKMIRTYFDKGKRILLLLCFFVCLFIYYLPIPELKLKYLSPFVFAAAFIIVDILSKLSLVIDKKSDSYDFIPNEQEAFKRVADEIQNLCSKRKRVDASLSVKVIGLRGR